MPADKITEARVNELAGVVDKYRPGSSYQRIADAMVRNNEVPTIEKVAARHRARKEARLRREAPPVPVVLTGSVVDQLLVVIGQSWKHHGHGPTWGEVGERMGWDRREVRDALVRLRAEGVVEFTVESGSLRQARTGARSA
ncbi:hypothetical protein [Arthrobacter sp. SD76]|uniref:hypothetical protein n=1 Tax=Arthrobacter sp. SD76 TaxID=3415007 RepID=UPI003C76B37C